MIKKKHLILLDHAEYTALVSTLTLMSRGELPIDPLYPLDISDYGKVMLRQVLSNHSTIIFNTDKE